MPAVIYQNPPEQLVAYYARHVYTLAEEAVHVQRSIGFAPTLRVITFYGEPMNWRQMA